VYSVRYQFFIILIVAPHHRFNFFVKKGWEDVLKLQKDFPDPFEGLAKALVQNESVWKQVCGISVLKFSTP